jgi:hypothetical protein
MAGKKKATSPLTEGGVPKAAVPGQAKPKGGKLKEGAAPKSAVSGPAKGKSGAKKAD